MTLADDLKPLLHSVRGLLGEMGLRPYRVYIIQGSWSGAFTGRGTETTESDEITEASGQPPKVRFLSDDQLALGQLNAGTVDIGPITPSFTSGGTALADLIPAVTRGETVHVRLVGPSYPTGARFLVTSVGDDRALHYTLRAQPVSET